MIRNILKTITIGTVLIGTTAFAEQPKKVEAPATISEEQTINLAGRQRMLSQRMAKDYFYAGKKINKGNALKQLKKSLEDFKKSQGVLDKKISDEEIVNLLAFVNMSLEEFVTISKEEFSVDNATIILDLSESILEGSDYVVQALKKGKPTNNIIDIAGKQRMLSQRIGKYYIAYQAGIKDDNTIAQMKETVKKFDTILTQLLANKNNTPQIQTELEKVKKMWKIVYKFYLNIEKGGLPIIVFSTTDDITSNMNKIVSMYVKALEKK